MSVHDLEMFTRGALAADLAVLATWWLTGRAERRKAARRAAARERAAEDKGYSLVSTPGGDQQKGRR